MNESPPPLAIVIISNCSPGSSYVIRELLTKFNVTRIIRPVWTLQCAASTCVVRSPLGRLVDKVNDKYRELSTAALSAAVKNYFNVSIDALPGQLIESFRSSEINSEAVRQLLESLRPDLVVVCGAPILKKELYQIPRLGSINIHLGISPKYRGEHTLLWPYLKDDLSNIGVTIHYLTPVVDGGAALLRGYLAVAPTDTEKTLLIKSYQMAARLITQFLDETAGHATTTDDNDTHEQSTLIRYRDRTIVTALRSFLKNLSHKYFSPLLATNEKIERYYMRAQH